MAFSTAADVEAYTRIDFDSGLESHLTNNLIPFVDEAIVQFVGYDLEQQTQVETFTGDQTKEIFLTHMPVRSITSLTEDDVALTEGSSADFIFYPNGRVSRLGKRWSYARERNIVVTYVAGYTAHGGGLSTDLPTVIKMVSARASARLLEAVLVVSSQQEPAEIGDQNVSAGTAGNFNLAGTERIGDYSATYSIGLDALSLPPLSQSDRSLLSPFRKSFFV